MFLIFLSVIQIGFAQFQPDRNGHVGGTLWDFGDIQAIRDHYDSAQSARAGWLATMQDRRITHGTQPTTYTDDEALRKARMLLDAFVVSPSISSIGRLTANGIFTVLAQGQVYYMLIINGSVVETTSR